MALATITLTLANEGEEDLIGSEPHLPTPRPQPLDPVSLILQHIKSTHRSTVRTNDMETVPCGIIRDSSCAKYLCFSEAMVTIVLLISFPTFKRTGRAPRRYTHGKK
jgi:hypothetical protein